MGVMSARHPELVLVVEDDDMIAGLMDRYLRRAGYRVAVAGDGLTGLRLIRELSPALVVLDLMLPELDGHTVASLAREERQLPIIMVTALSSTAERVSGLEAGADDYLAKPFAPSELVARVRSVLRRCRPPEPDRALRYAGLEVDPARRAARLDGRPLDLTAVEFDLLHALVRAEGRVLSRELLIDAVRRSETAEDIRDRSIDVYVRRLRSKLEDDVRSPTYILTVRGIGYRLTGR
jgi:DNA-binding response OmpR family regulator